MAVLDDAHGDARVVEEHVLGTCGGARDESRAPETIEYEGHFVVAAEIFKVRNAVAEAWVLLWLT